MKRCDFTIGVTAASLALGTVPEALAASMGKAQPRPYAATDAYKPRRRLLPRMAGTKQPFAQPSATTQIPVEKSFGVPRLFVWDEDSGVVTRPGQTAKQRTQEYDAMLPHTDKPVYLTVEVDYVHASSYFANRKKEIIQFKPTITQVKELPELSNNQQTLSWAAVLKSDLNDNVTGKMMSTPLSATALTSLMHMPIINGVALFSLPYVGTSLNKNHTLELIDQWLGTFNSLVKIAGGIPGVLIDAATIGAFTTAQSVVDQLILLFSQGKARNEEAFSPDAVLLGVMQTPSAPNERDLIRIPKDGQTYIIVPAGDPHDPSAPSQAVQFEAAVRGKKVKGAANGALAVEGQAANYLDLFNYAIARLSVTTS